MPLVSQASDRDVRIINVPYYSSIGNEIKADDNAMCEKQARVSAKALQNAQIGITLAEQLETWDTFVASPKAEKYTALDLAKFRALINMGWEVYAKYPELDPNQFGDYVYEACVMSKMTEKTVTF